MLKDGGDIVVGRVKEFAKIVLDFDVIMRAGQAKSCRSFQRPAGRVIQLTDQRFQIHIATPLLIREPAPCHPDPAGTALISPMTPTPVAARQCHPHRGRKQEPARDLELISVQNPTHYWKRNEPSFAVA